MDEVKEVEVEEEEILEAEEDEEYDEEDKENLTDEGEEPDDECLLLINRSKSDCFMNTIANLLYSCKGVRAVIRNADLYREDSPLKNILLKLFSKESNSTREWRQALRDESYHSEHQDVGEIFKVLIEVSFLRGVELSYIEPRSAAGSASGDLSGRLFSSYI